jgi:penicillin-binding protein 1A
MVERWLNDLKEAAGRSQTLPVVSEIGRNPRSYLHLIGLRVQERLADRHTRLGAAVMLLMAAGMFVVLVAAGVFITQTPSMEELRTPSIAEASIVYSADGKELARYHIENRTWVSLDRIAPSAIEALIATEDHRFYRHNGIDVPRIFGAVLGTASGDTQGGSTITMQLARNLFPEVRNNSLLTRKVKEWVTALKLEDVYTKEEILELYLNIVPFMYEAAGIEAAALTYFQKPASDLTPSESATLIGLLKATAYYNPVRYPERSQARRNTVLAQMARHGYLDEAEYEQIKDQPVELSFRRISRHENEAPFFAEYLRQWLDTWVEQQGHNLYVDGLRVYTTVDSRLQDAAQTAVQEVTEDMQHVVDVEWSSPSPFYSSDAEAYKQVSDRVEPFAYFWRTHQEYLEQVLRESTEYAALTGQGYSGEQAMEQLLADEALVDSLKQLQQRLEAGFVAIDPSNGHVKAWVGGRDFRQREYDHVAVARRQPGSTFKPFVYAAALENGYAPYSALTDAVMEYRDPWTGEVWAPRNFGNATGNILTLSQALALSKNTITARLITSIGADKVVQVAQKMGINSPLQAVPSLALGTSEVSLLELASAYTTLANLGKHNDPVLVTRIEDRDGNVLAAFASQPEEAIPSYTAYAVLDMMRGGIQYGTAVRMRSMFGARGDLAAKTGTTQNGADGWFMLVHPNLVMGAWMGFYSPTITFRTQYWGQGAHNALHLVGRFYQQVGPNGSDMLSTEARFAEPADHTWETRFVSDSDRLNQRERRNRNLDRILERIRRRQ